MRLQLIALAAFAAGCPVPDHGVEWDTPDTNAAAAETEGGGVDGDADDGNAPGGSGASNSGSGPSSDSNATSPAGDGSTTDDSAGATMGLSDGGDEPGSSTGEPPPPPPVSVVEWNFGTSTYAGQFAPANIVAAWIEADDGTFIVTLIELGVIEDIHLIEWNARTSGNLTDAITGASPMDHASVHSGSWFLTDAAGSTVPDGDYVLRLEMTESNSAGMQPPGPLFDIPFTLGNGHFDLQPAGNQFFHTLRAYGHD